MNFVSKFSAAVLAPRVAIWEDFFGCRARLPEASRASLPIIPAEWIGADRAR